MQYAGVTHKRGVTERRLRWSLQTRHTVTALSFFLFLPIFFHASPQSSCIRHAFAWPIQCDSFLFGNSRERIPTSGVSRVWTSSSSLYIRYSGGFSSRFFFFLASEQISRKFSTVMTNSHDDFE